jgi:hypothetical protein
MRYVMFVWQNPYLKVVYFCFFYIFSGTVAAGQVKDTLTIGSISGKVKDSTYNFMLTSATIAVYKDSNSSLLQYTLPNNLGEFTVRNLPLNTPLRLIVTHVGYKDLIKKFTIPVDKKELGMGMLYLHQLGRDSSGNMLDQVVVTAIAPMRMKGDTLEFNADAFKMDPNATTEDLMRRLPGIVIWGDGDITFNGKKIQQVLVDGKPFMGTNDITVATQNLPKNVIDKVQIYQQHDPRNPLDSTMYANLKLKEDKKMGYFGKVSAGSGASPASISTDKRYATDGMLSGFNKKLQIATVAAANNINKVAGDIDALLKNSSFKGEGASLEYQSDFNMSGVNKPVMAGVRLQNDFIADVQNRNISRLNADYFINQNNKGIINTNLEKNYINADTILSRQSNSTSYNRSSNQHASARYALDTEKHSFNISAAGTLNEDKSKNESNSTQEKTGVGIINKINSVSENNSTAKNVQAGFSFTRQEPYSFISLNKRRIPAEFTIGYSISAGGHTGSSQSQSNYEFTNEPQRNLNVSRIYAQRNSSSVAHNFNVSYPRLKELIFGKRSFGGINLELSAWYKLYHYNNNDEVLDLDTNIHSYTPNIWLTFRRVETVRDLTPRLHLSKTFYKGLTNRYKKYVSINVNAVQQYYKYSNSSTQAIQNIGYSYHKFMPDASIVYGNHQYGQYEVKYSLGYNSKAYYPNVWQMAPLVDAANPLYLPKGNRNLKPEYHQDVNFNYTFDTRKPKNPWHIDAGVSLGKVTDNIVDSTLYDNGGGKTIYTINIEGFKYLNGSINIRKALAVNKANTFELGAHYNYSLSNDPRYIDSKLNLSTNRSQGGNFNVSYRHKDVVQAKLEQSLYYNNAEQRGFNNNRFKSNSRYTRAIATLQFPRNLVWSSNITYNRNVADGTDAINFSIWNASLTYRFLKGNQGEVKFSALDLLRQNKGITNNVSGNVQNFGYTNVLQQYFMCTLAYYPRKFGK